MKCKYHYGEYMYILKVFKFVVRDCKRFTVKRAYYIINLCTTLNFVAYTYRNSKNYSKSDGKYVKSPNFSLKFRLYIFQVGKFIVYLQFLDLILQYSEIQQFTVSLQIKKLLIFTCENTA